ncbi:hypothetical protein AMS68_003757 [Peltaster fructicola]|uniref:Bromo domain-containing protein n=1 Tax=Peltaster fructicola TaxID=286661 RepID=A0A6H0XUW6_9PEZI|nr:hypothetical protein AMS68_003757 [Peltaster fructicola]
MANYGTKRKAYDDPNKSDSDDLDYGDEPPARPQGRRGPRTHKRKAPKRQRYGGSDSDVSIDDDESDEISFVESEGEEEELERNPRTGRGVRSVAKKPITYEDPSDEEELEDSDRDPIAPTPKKKKKVRQIEEPTGPLIVTLKVSPQGLERFEEPRRRTGGKGPVKRSLNHEHRYPEPQFRRASKGLKKPPPSAILEVSQEYSQSQQHNADIPEVGAHPEMTTSAAGDTQPDEIDELAHDVHPSREEIDESMDDDDAPVKHGRTLRTRRQASTPPKSQTRRSLRTRKTGAEPSSDFEPDVDAEGEEDDDLSESDGMLKPTRGSSNGDSQISRRAGRHAGKGRASQRSRSARHDSDNDDDELDPDEIADEAADLADDNRRNRRSRRRAAQDLPEELKLRTRANRPDYRIMRPELLQQIEDDEAVPAAATPSRGRRGVGAVYRSLFQTAGPFGGLGGPTPVFGADAQGAAGGVDSDSSDDELALKIPQNNVGGTVGMTPTSAFPKPFNVAQTHNSDPLQDRSGGPPGLGKVKDRKALADADPLGVDPNVGFESVGGLDDHIDRLKEMVALPLLYPEVFQRFHVTPPRGVLFHGPPGTGKTLLARALASSVSSHGRKVTFYMRKGADALSKWVGEAEKQLRLLFEEARKNQPSIIFFDEIDGLAPVRSSKQEQIHASIVATLLALMDGMDGRGQVIVIGATNRPDSVDPALRRPGRFDREFYFPLPSLPARRAIIDIHTKGWEPPLAPKFKDTLAELTKGYGGADLRALCTEAALNAVQGTYPQIYSSDKKLIIDPSTIKVLAKDFMISVGKIVPSSERSAASGAVPLKKEIEPLLRQSLEEITAMVDKVIPRKRKATALEEAMYDDREDELGFERETMQRQFEASRIFRPRLLIKGQQGMGQQYVGAALLSKLEGLHVQNFGLSVLLADSTRSPEAAIIQLFEEVKRHKPSIIYIPNVDGWYKTLSEGAIKTFVGLLRSLPPTEPVLLLGILEYGLSDDDKIDHEMLRNLFGYSLKSHFELKRPSSAARAEFFQHIMEYIKRPPTDFPDPENRKRRKLIDLPVAAEPVLPPTEPSKAELKAQKKKDRQTLNLLKLNIQQVMDQIKLKYKKFRTPIIEDSAIKYLYDEQGSQARPNDVPEDQGVQELEFRPYEIDKDEKGVLGLREVASGKFYYNLEIVTIEKRLSNGYYKRPKDFLADIKRLAKDAKTVNDQDRILKANEMLANVEVDMTTLETQQPALVAECEAVYNRELLREHERVQKEREALRQGEDVPRVTSNVPPPIGSKTTTETTGPVVLGEELSGKKVLGPPPPRGLVGPSPDSRWSNSNGVRPQTNGSSVPSRPQEDSEMYDASQDPIRPFPLAPGVMASYGTPNQRSQKSVHTQMVFGSQLDLYHNSASTTSSGQKTGQTSGQSNRSSGPYSAQTHQSNGNKEYPDFNTLPATAGGSQLPDTQSSQSQPEPEPVSPTYNQSMAPPPLQPLQKPTAITALLNDTTEPSTTSVPADKPTASAASMHLILDDPLFANLLKALVDGSSGLGVEQLEQVHATLMDAIWETKREWNRVKASKAVELAFNEIIKDIEACQRIMKASQEDS